jgi:hypothetical protein
MSTNKHQGKQPAIPQQDMRILHGGSQSPMPCSLQNYDRRLRTNRVLWRDSHGVARLSESLRSLRLPLVPDTDGNPSLLLILLRTAQRIPNPPKPQTQGKTEEGQPSHRIRRRSTTPLSISHRR